MASGFEAAIHNLDQTVSFVFNIDLKTSSTFIQNPEYNESLRWNIENWCNEVLSIVPYKHMVLNDVLDRLGIDRIQYGYRYGWRSKTLDKIIIEFRKQTPTSLRIEIITAGDIWEDIPNG